MRLSDGDSRISRRQAICATICAGLNITLPDASDAANRSVARNLVEPHGKQIDDYMKTICRVADKLDLSDRAALLDAANNLWVTMASAEMEACYWRAKHEGTWSETDEICCVAKFEVRTCA